MRRDARAYLWDIQQAANAIMRFLEGLDAATFTENELIYSAVERKFEIIGEALGQLSKVDPDLAQRIPDMLDIIAFRNVLIHGYAGIDQNRVWDVAQSSLPGLQTVVEDLLEGFAG